MSLQSREALDTYDKLEDQFDIDSDNEDPAVIQKFISALREVAAAEWAKHSGLSRKEHESSRETLRYAIELWELSEDALSARYREGRADEREQAPSKSEAIVDFGSWALVPLWTLDEAVALSFGKDPSLVNYSDLEDLEDLEEDSPFAQKDSPFAQKYAARYEILSRAVRAGQLSAPLIPGKFVEWALIHEIEIPPVLKEAVGPVVDWKDQHEKDQRKIAQLNDELKKYKLIKEDVHPTGRLSMLKIIATMLHMHFDKRFEKRDIVGAIHGHMGQIPLSLDRKPIGDWIKEARGLLPKEVEDPKPESNR